MPLSSADYGNGSLCSVKRDQDGLVHMMRGKDNNKDQTYFWVNCHKNNCKRPFLSHLVLCSSNKERTGLATAKKKILTGYLLYWWENFKEFLSQYLTAWPGRMMTWKAEICTNMLGWCIIPHKGGLGIGGQHGGDNEPWFVLVRSQPKYSYVGQGFIMNNPNVNCFVASQVLSQRKCQKNLNAAKFLLSSADSMVTVNYKVIRWRQLWSAFKGQLHQVKQSFYDGDEFSGGLIDGL